MSVVSSNSLNEIFSNIWSDRENRWCTSYDSLIYFNGGMVSYVVQNSIFFVWSSIFWSWQFKLLSYVHTTQIPSPPSSSIPVFPIWSLITICYVLTTFKSFKKPWYKAASIYISAKIVVKDIRRTSEDAYIRTGQVHDLWNDAQKNWSWT